MGIYDIESSMPVEGLNAVQPMNSDIRFVIPYGIPMKMRKKPATKDGRISLLFLRLHTALQIGQGRSSNRLLLIVTTGL